MSKTLDQWMQEIASINIANGWFDKNRGFGEDIALLHSEVSEAYEGYRNGDDENVREELADVFIRLMDTCTRYSVDLEVEVDKKLAKNKKRGYRHGGKVV